jgi:hypothetical protein
MAMTALRLILILLLMAGTAACEAVADIFQAGVWVGVILAVGVIGLLIFLFGRRG